MQSRKIPVNVTEAAVERQIQIEETAKTRAIDKSRKAVRDALDKGRASELLPVSRVISAAFSTVSDSIEQLKAEKASGVGGKYRKFIRGVPTDVLATGALVYVIDSLCHEHQKNSSAQSLMSGLGRFVQAELLNLKLQKVAPAYMNRVHEYMKERQTRSASHILRTLRASAEAVKLEEDPWSNTECIKVGRLLLTCVFSTGLFRWVQNKGTQMMYLVPDDSLESVLTDVITQGSMMMIAPPMVIPPVPHTTLFDGGYITEIDRRGTYRNRHITNRHRREIAAAFEQATELKRALNIIQSVPYQINKDILETVQAARAQGVGVGMPSTKEAKKPVWRLDGVPKDSYSAQEQEDFAGWKLEMRTWYSENRIRISKLRGIATSLEIASEFKDEPALYFPTCVDWRYRVYFKSALNPQGSDLQKALLQFGRGKALGANGLFWLKVHVATCFGYDKALFKERAAWVDLHYTELERVAANPFDCDAFRDADSPWCFLAALRDLVNAVRSGDPQTYVSHIPVAMDATNSGGQHFSAMLRDTVGGRLTNLYWTGNPEKADLYMDVKQRTDAKVAGMLSNLDTVVQAKFWTDNEVTRKMTKRPAMTFFYSATARSCSEYIFLGALEEGYAAPEDFSMMKLAGFLSGPMRTSIEEAMPAATAAMKYMQQLCRRIPLANHLQFLTPLGGLVMNRYSTTEEQRVSIQSMGIQKIVAYNRNYDENNRRKATSGVAPNGVHSQDGTHLCMVVLRDEGIDILPIHDSLATHACDVDAMQANIRGAFVDLYEQHDFLETVREAAVAAGADVEDIERPELGDLDIRQVLESPFFFC